MNTIIQQPDGSYYDLDDIGVKTVDFVVSAPAYTTEYEPADGMDGAHDLGTTLEPRTITADFYMKAKGTGEDYAELRDEVFSIFRSRRPFYVINTRSPSKRWLVKVEGSFEMDQQQGYGFFTVELVAASGVSESINISSRSFDTQTIHFMNSGNVPIDMRTQDVTEMTFTGASDGLSITNMNTSEVWKYNGVTEAGDVLRLKGVRSEKNGVSIFGQTNRKIITLVPGMNELKISGATDDFRLEIRSRFYFL